MQKLLLCSLILLAVIGNSQLFTQKVHDQQCKEKASYGPSVTDIESIVEMNETKASESLDSLSSKSKALVNNTSYSLNHLAKIIETKTTGSCSSNLS